MPFRTLHGYTAAAVVSRDPTEEEVREYLAWLRAEVAVTEEYLVQRFEAPRTAAPAE